MALDAKIIELINADLDGEIGADEKRELDSILVSSEEARRYRAEMSTLCDVMGSAAVLEPPGHLHDLIMESANSRRASSTRPVVGWRFPGVPALRLATAFAAGAVLTWALVSSDGISRNAFEDVTDLVGTISDSRIGLPGSTAVSVSHADVAGTISMRKTGRLLVVDFDLVSNGPMDVVAGFAKSDIWFNGFAQLESSGTSVAAEPGQVTISMDGKRRYALYLHDSGGKVASIDFTFVSSGRVVHEARLPSDLAK